MSNLNITIADKIAQACFNLYSKLPKTGKPVINEWTVLSCIVKYDTVADNIEVVSLGTGSKCIGATKMSPKGDVLNDSHAEVFARRGFLLYLYENIEKAINNQGSIFISHTGKFKLKENIQFVFYSSQLPCGDASIIPKTGEEEQFGDVLRSYKRQADDISEAVIKKQKLHDDVHRTGAKCLPHSEQDPKQSGKKFHLLGCVRTKPGRGDRTLSVSCSDKLAKWIHLGIQGSLLSLLCEPIYIKYFVFGAGVPYSELSLSRALLKRSSECCLAPELIPEFYQTTLLFQHIRTEDNHRPAPGSIVWMKLNYPLLEVAVQGKKLGVTKKKANSLNSSLCISKYNIYTRFLSILNKKAELKQSLISENDVSTIPYNNMKRKATKHTSKWVDLKNTFFKTWTSKPDIWNFCVKI